MTDGRSVFRRVSGFDDPVFGFKETFEIYEFKKGI